MRRLRGVAHPGARDKWAEPAMTGSAGRVAEDDTEVARRIALYEAQVARGGEIKYEPRGK